MPTKRISAASTLRTATACIIDFDYRGKGLQLEFTVEDPNVFTAPWGAKVTYLRAGSFFQEQVCAENTREYYDDVDTKIPVAEHPDF